MANSNEGYVTLAIHTYGRAMQLKTLLETHGINVSITSVNLDESELSSGLRVRIPKRQLPQALSLVEQNVIITQEFNIMKPVVLVPIDFHSYSKRVINLAFEFASQLRLPIVLLHSIVGNEMPGNISFTKNRLIEISGTRQSDKEEEERQKALFNILAADLREQIEQGLLPEVPFRLHLAYGIPEEAIYELTKELRVAIAVMGTRDKTTKQIDLTGSVTAEVIDNGKFPIIAIPENYQIKKLSEVKKVVFITNMNQDDLRSFDNFIHLFTAKTLDITLIPESQISKVGEEQLLTYCTRTYKNHNYHIHQFTKKDFFEELNEYLRKEQYDLIIIPNKRRNIFSRLFNPSVAHKLLFSTEIPLFVSPQ